ncbi:MAG TPA: 4Fe-4S double cluster binding domain-containing protein [Acidimicrobiia bacterium]|jgi:epoxyqueuosine reductase
MSERLTAELRVLAESVGAAGFGVAGADRFQRELLALHNHKASGRAGPLRFTYGAPESATDIRASFPWAERLVVVGWNYLAVAASPDITGPLVGRFATSDQYQPVRQVAEALAAHLRRKGYRAEILIDDNRLVDRAAAVRAGVGWSGRNTMVLAPGHGPWMLLGSVVTDAPLATTDPMQRSCGTCVACIPACPTQALDEHGLDARRCLSTWLQTPGSIPQWIRPLLGRRIYGCDDCLTVCPPGTRALAEAGNRPTGLMFAEMLALDDKELLDSFSWWYVPRRQGRFIRRNLLVAAGNAGEAGSWSPALAHTTHPSSMIRGHAYWALARGWGAEARPVLRERLPIETVPEARDELVLALLMLEHPEAHRSILAVDEWVGADETLLGAAVIGATHLEPVGLTVLVLYEGEVPVPITLEGVTLVCVPADSAEVDRPLVIFNDRDRIVESVRRLSDIESSTGPGLTQ